MKIEVNLLEGQQLQASFGEHSITSDQSVAAGGQGRVSRALPWLCALPTWHYAICSNSILSYK